MIHFLLYGLIILAIIGLILWGISSLPGIPAPVKTVIYVIVGVVLLIWLLNYLPHLHIPQGP